MTIDASGNIHNPKGSRFGGRFTNKANSSPAGGLDTAPADPVEAFRTFLATPPTEDLSMDGRRGRTDVASRFEDEDLLRQQPLSYVAWLAHSAHESAAGMADRVPPGSPGAQYWTAAAARADEIADKLYELSGTNRYPLRNPSHIGDDGQTGEQAWARALAEREVRSLAPTGITATRRAVRILGSDDRDSTQLVSLTWGSVPPAVDKPLEVSGPSDGRPLLIDVQSGCPTMTVQKGKVVIRVGGNGFGITVAAGAHAVVIGQPGHKVSITAEAGSTVDFYTEPDSRGYQSIAGGANFRMHGRADNVTLSSDAR